MVAIDRKPDHCELSKIVSSLLTSVEVIYSFRWIDNKRRNSGHCNNIVSGNKLFCFVHSAFRCCVT